MTLENIIWEAKQRPSSLRDSRRPSTTVDDTGCVVVKGFVVPSRTSSFDSIATSTTSSHETPGTPLSPIDDAPPGYSRPSGSLWYAPELECIKDESSRSLHRPTRSAGSVEFGGRPFRPAIGPRRSTWQQPASSRRREMDSLSAKCQSNTGLKAEMKPQQPPAPFPQSALCFGASKKPVRRNITDQLALPKHDEGQAKRAYPKVKNVKIATEVEADSAIASNSDSDSEEEFCEPWVGLIMGGIAAQRMRPNYAARRTLSDQRVRQREEARTSAGVAPSQQIESAIESDEEEADDDDDDTGPPCKADENVTAALDLAKLHRSRNSVTALVELVNDDCDTTSRRPERLSAPRATFVPTRLSDDSCETPTVMRSFAPQSPMAKRPLRPSRSQPPPVKGVLKHGCSRATSPSDLSARRGSAPYIVGPSRASIPTVQKTNIAPVRISSSVCFTTTSTSTTTRVQ